MTDRDPNTDPAVVPGRPVLLPDVLLCHSCGNRWMTEPDDELCDVCAEAARQGIPLFRWDGQPL